MVTCLTFGICQVIAMYDVSKCAKQNTFRILILLSVEKLEEIFLF